MNRFDHVVVVMLENQSFDRILGWVPGADGRTGTDGNTADPNGPLGVDRVPVHPGAEMACVSGPHFPPERVFSQILEPESGFVAKPYFATTLAFQAAMAGRPRCRPPSSKTTPSSVKQRASSCGSPASRAKKRATGSSSVSMATEVGARYPLRKNARESPVRTFG